jgi:RNA-directed DNA polymerase
LLARAVHWVSTCSPVVLSFTRGDNLVWLRTIDLLSLPRIDSIDDLSHQIGLSNGLLYKMARVPDSFYRSVTILKKNGGIRVLACPSAKIKAVQAWILRNILDNLSIHPSAKAYVKGGKLTDNVTPHLGRKFFLCLDLVDFFGSIKYHSVYQIFCSLGYAQEVSSLLANICCYRGSLPQGGVTSPALSNLACIRLDKRLSGFSGARRITYTRYADDLTFSADDPDLLVSIQPTIKQIVSENQFRLNEAKTRFLGPRQCHKITGLVINGNTCGVGRKQKRVLRAKIHRLETKQLDDDERETLRNHVNGWMSFLRDVDIDGYKQLSDYWCELRDFHATTGQVAVTEDL